jgi:hypothetical protein
MLDDALFSRLPDICRYLRGLMGAGCDTIFRFKYAEGTFSRLMVSFDY